MKKRKRRVFGKRRVKILNSTYALYMLKDKLTCRELYSRREYEMSLTDIVDYLIGQEHFSFQ